MSRASAERLRSPEAPAKGAPLRGCSLEADPAAAGEFAGALSAGDYETVMNYAAGWGAQFWISIATTLRIAIIVTTNISTP